MTANHDGSFPSTFEFIFQGTGSSSGLPNVGCLTSKPLTCETCASTLTPEGWKNKRRNTGGIVRIRCPDSNTVNERVLVIDVGKTFWTAAVELFPRHKLRTIDAVLLTHGHADAWTFGRDRIQDYIDVYLSADTLKVITGAFPYLVSKEHATGSGNVADFRWHIIKDNKPFQIMGLDIEITPLAVHHGQLNPHKNSTVRDLPGDRNSVVTPEPYMCFGFMFGDIMLYMSDVSSIPDAAWRAIEARGALYEVFVVDCYMLNSHISHFGVKEMAEAAKRINARKTYLIGFGHKIPRDAWETIGRYIGGEGEEEVRPSVRQALDTISILGVEPEKGRWIRPAYDARSRLSTTGVHKKVGFARFGPSALTHNIIKVMNLRPGTETIRFRRPTNTTETPAAPKLARHTGLLQDQIRRTARAPWCPSFSVALRMIVLVRICAATYSNIQDCDEVFNFWEPLHYLDQGHGFQTWETSPAYGLRSWAYVLLHLLPAKAPIWLLSFEKRHAFFGLRMIFGAITSWCEAKFYRAVVENINDRVGRYLLFMLLFSAGMWNASTAFLPSTFAMYTTTAACSFSFVPPSASRTQRTLAATVLFATGAVVGWPFSLLLAVPFVLEELLVYGGDIVPQSSHSSWIQARWKRLFGSSAVAALLFAPVFLVDSYAYGQPTLTPWNLVKYNIFSGSSGRGPTLYGSEPWYFYLVNLTLNFNILLPFALISLPALLITYRFDYKRLGAKRGPDGQATSPYTLLAFRMAPFYLWIGVLTAQAHKEERFMYPAYPLLCFNAAATLYLMRGWMEVAYIKATSSPYRASQTPIFRLSTLATVVLTTLLSISRILALYKYYHAPLDVAHHFQYVELTRLLNATHLLPVPNTTQGSHANKYDDDVHVDLTLVRQFGLKICWGAEWYRFPGSYLVPSGVEPLLVESGFDGMLPRPFSPVVEVTALDPKTTTSSFSPVVVQHTPSHGLFGETFRVLGHTTRVVPSGFNDLNRAEEGQAADPRQCDYYVHLRLPGSAVVPADGNWEDVACFPFLDAAHSSVLTRVLWVPGGVWQQGNTFGEYCLLREKEKADAREAKQWSKTA